MLNLLLLLSTVTFLGTASGAMGNSRDTSTYANIDEVYATHMDLDFAVDFDNQLLKGHVIITFNTSAENVNSVWLDAEGMYVTNVEYGLGNNFHPVAFFMTRPNNNLGNAVEVELPQINPVGTTFMLKVSYFTNDQTTAISWLQPSQTAGGQHPYLFTQCEDIACRSVAPMQDTPAIRITYTAKVTVANPLVPFMSANQTNVEKNDTHSVTFFQNSIPMPSYLIALAVGDLVEKAIDSRTNVITEPSQIDKVAATLGELGNLLNTTESYLTPYIWGKYSILVLPPSFPMGGMENPLLTFASPTIITEDKSQVYVATHEIAHSWTGNEVTCQNWNNFWLNEGFTVYIERNVSGILYGEDFSKVNAYLGNLSMFSAMQEYGLNHTYSSLYPDVQDDKPDNSFSTIPYEKGYQLLTYLEWIVGEQDMQDMLQEWIQNHTLTSQNWTVFKDHFHGFVINKYKEEMAQEMLSDMNWDLWIFQGGLPPNYTDFTTVALNESKQIANDYVSLAGDKSPDNYTDYNNYTSNLRVVFLEELLSPDNFDKVDEKIITKIDTDLNITMAEDPEVRQRWFPLGIKKNYTAVMEPAKTFVQSMGRWKYVKPIYKALLDSGNKDMAIEWFQEKQDFYHPYVVEQLKRLIGIEGDIIEPKQPALVKRWDEKFLQDGPKSRFIN